MSRRFHQLDESLVYFEPRTDLQAHAKEVFKQNDITFLLGPAGTGKTHLAVAFALQSLDLRETGRARGKIIVTRPIVEAGESLGYLPGEVEEKVHPYMLPIYDCVSKMVNGSEKVIAERFEIAPLAYMRGRTFENCVAILDEAQNCSFKQFEMFLTRLGNGGKLIITGDPNQSDIGRDSALNEVVYRLNGEPGIGFVHFSEADNIRHPLVGRIVELLNRRQFSGQITNGRVLIR